MKGCCRPWLVANRATLPQKLMPPSRNEADSSRWAASTVYNFVKSYTCSDETHLVQDSGFRVSGSGFEVSGFWFQVSSFGFRVLGFGF